MSSSLLKKQELGVNMTKQINNLIKYVKKEVTNNE